jgi:signal transduction histidine kinase
MLGRLHVDYPELNCTEVIISKDQVLFKEGDALSNLYIILEGKVRLFKQSLHNNDESLIVDTLVRGNVVGIMAFATRHPSLTTAQVLVEGRAVRIPTQGFYQTMEQNPRLYHTVMSILTQDLGERYRHTLFSQLDFDAINHKLDEERARLKNTLEELEKTQIKLVQKEKMATLGQLTAGFAHEVNNPAAALIRATDVLVEQLPQLMANKDIKTFFTNGQKAEVMDTESIRDRSASIAKHFPKLNRSLHRLIAQMPEDLVLNLKGKSQEDQIRFARWFESGKYLRNIEVSGKRIAGLVQSMKNYARQDKNEPEPLDIRQGIKDTLLVLSNRTKFYKLKTKLEEVPLVLARAGSLNQVWTNLIVNACDAMGKDGELSIHSYTNKETNFVEVCIKDNGSGIPEDIHSQVFEANFSTKDHDTKFGLGLGLHLSKQIVDKHKGNIRFESNENGTAFYVSLPAYIEN